MKETASKIAVFSIAIAIVIMGYCIYKGLHSFADKERVVAVRGLSEHIVNADYANLTIKYEVADNDMTSLLATIEANNKKIKEFATSKGVTESEITVKVPKIEDRQASGYVSDKIVYRYYASVSIVLMSSKVTNVRDIEMSQFDLYKQGIKLVNGSIYDYSESSGGSYTFTKLNDIKPQMIQESIKNAKKAADEFASSSDSKVKNIKSAYQGQFEIIPTDDPLKVKVRVVSTIQYFIK